MQDAHLLVKITVILACLHDCVSLEEYFHGQRCFISSTTNAPKRGDCSTYLRCVNGRWRDYKCPAGGVFSRKKGLCTWPQYHPECFEPTTNTSKMILTNDACIFPCPEDGSKFMYPKFGTCDDFYLCDNRQVYSAACSDIPPAGTYKYFNYFMFSCDRYMESNNVCSMSL